MTAAAHPAPTLGILLMTLGMVAILAIPYVLRSSLNKTIEIPPGIAFTTTSAVGGRGVLARATVGAVVGVGVAVSRVAVAIGVAHPIHPWL